MSDYEFNYYLDLYHNQNARFQSLPLTIKCNFYERLYSRK